MDNALMNFAFEDELCRVVIREGEPWFVAKDVCRVLDVQNVSQAVAPLDEDEKGICSTYTPGGDQEVLVVSESGLYTLMIRSRLSTTAGTVQHRFRKWVFGEVLPEIRRTGAYAARGQREGWDWEDIGLKLQMVREARLQHGRKVSSRLWVKLGLPMPDDEPVAPVETAHGVDFVQRFLAERTAEQPGGRVQASMLYAAWQDWARENDAPTMTVTSFGRTLAALGLNKDTSRHVFYLGIRIRHRNEVTG